MQETLDAGDEDSPGIGVCLGEQRAGLGETLRDRRESGGILERIAGRDEKPDLVQPQPVQGRARDVQVPRMRRIEAAAEQPDARAPPVAEAWECRLVGGVGARWHGAPV